MTNTVGESPTPDVWRAIQSYGSPMSFTSGEVLMHHGASGRTCYAICSGTVLLTVTSTQGSTLVLGRRETGSLVGELAALAGAPRAATVRAKGDVATIRLQWEAFHQILHDHPDWAIQLLRILAGRVRGLSERFAVRNEELRVRLIDILTTHYEESGDPVFRSTREELAGWVGATREAVVRTLQQLKSDGVVDLDRGAVELLKP